MVFGHKRLACNGFRFSNDGWTAAAAAFSLARIDLRLLEVLWRGSWRDFSSTEYSTIRPHSAYTGK